MTNPQQQLEALRQARQAAYLLFEQMQAKEQQPRWWRWLKPKLKLLFWLLIFSLCWLLRS